MPGQRDGVRARLVGGSRHGAARGRRPAPGRWGAYHQVRPDLRRDVVASRSAVSARAASGGSAVRRAAGAQLRQVHHAEEVRPGQGPTLVPRTPDQFDAIGDPPATLRRVIPPTSLLLLGARCW